MDFPLADSSNGFPWTTSSTSCVNESHCLSVSCSSWAVINRGALTHYLNSPYHHPTICLRPYVISLFKLTFSKVKCCPSLPSPPHYQVLNELQKASIAWGIQDRAALYVHPDSVWSFHSASGNKEKTKEKKKINKNKKKREKKERER